MSTQQHDLYAQAGKEFAPAIARLAKAVEREPEKARDLEQDIHCELFKSFARFEGNCALKTWVYRVSHNVAAEHRMKAMRGIKPVPLDEIDELPASRNPDRERDEADAIARAHALIRQLPLLDAQVMLLWLEGESGKEIAEVTGLGAPAVATRIHRLKAAIGEQLSSPTPEGETP